ncbi:MAG TPA: 16S rRNA (cytosine(967)-C(5))-methyltransferase RsmB [Gammaproteobacteria bacterium]|jgi:16S rRNA (cytosine967-C5)-methyltransferase|nr:16S rRNA (cytosine(967)-C(5))-methyltransferase RsmB [Xanthomonadales bacterium]HOP22058.1 16S rRNA (cytosine(967)-C(5))-methyltransferase RsmB [Gammaproteobacteria bacterium]MCB1594703.1 16S rRNA (cytosine(967)-C(5))-methyltransferase RsmB [Xanthomonadales bacterium]MCB1603502.1 16S rRNA (cytosine(967)-C(5))-methyltransferase RsmB [Xanthomonadales bacterium]HPI95045.1 16S rRNA (cytosine(967)-C(5))-methyltransferase RsmB [Gammaproteobacteria bacterium]
MKKINSRTLSAKITYDVVFKKDSLRQAIQNHTESFANPQEESYAKAICYETLRHYHHLESCWLKFVKNKPKDKLVCVIMTQALAELVYLEKPARAVVNEAVNTAKNLKKQWAVGLINSCLRKSVEIKNDKSDNLVAQYSHPQWWIEKLQMDWPNHWQKILVADNQKPPLWIRANHRYKPIESAEQHQSINSAYKINAQDITKLDEFKTGSVSVQDASAQLAAIILNPQDNEKILDACAAPGGKTGHILELNPNVQLDALEIFPNRAKKIHQNLERLKLSANVLVADASQSGQWFNGDKYNKILLDAPCSASGIVRRQPDIKFQRSSEDLENIIHTQQTLLDEMAKIVADDGVILYATCSVFRCENSEQIKNFLQRHPQFKEIKLNYPFAESCQYGIQILTGTLDMDGFYYCCLKKCTS